MKVLLAIDGSEHSQAAVEEVASRDWPVGTEIAVVTVIHTKWPAIGDPLFIVASAHAESLLEQRRDAPELLTSVLKRIQDRTTGVAVTAKAIEGVPHDVIVQEAADWGADLIVLGSHGYGPVRRAILGSVAAAVAVEAPCAVEIIRMNRPPIAASHPSRQRPTQQVAQRSAGRSL